MILVYVILKLLNIILFHDQHSLTLPAVKYTQGYVHSLNRNTINIDIYIEETDFEMY